MKKRTYDKAFYQKLWGLMIPIVLQNLMLALVAVADAFMLGGMNQNYMSAVSLATQIQFIQNMFLAAATASLGILGAQYWGKGDIKTLDEIFCMALRLCGLVSVVFFAACVFAGKYLMLIFTNESVLIEHGVSYLRIAGFSYLLQYCAECGIYLWGFRDSFDGGTRCGSGNAHFAVHRAGGFRDHFLSEGLYSSSDEVPVLQK